MGFDELASYRDQFPVSNHLIYLNHAAVAPLVRPAAVAMQRLAEDVLQNGAANYQQWLEAYTGLRQTAARLINAQPDEIALMKNTSEGIATVALGIDWRQGDRVVAFEEEFPANQYPWRRLQEKGVKVQWLSVTDSLEKIDAAAKGARLLAISFVQFLTGYRADVEAIGRVCRSHGTLYFVDAIQGLGAFRWMWKQRESMRWRPMGTNGWSGRKAARFFTFPGECRTTSCRSSSAGPTSPGSTITEVARWRCGGMPAGRMRDVEHGRDFRAAGGD
jgi:selenocysteine lyase/cysteine desulfurase